MTKENWESLFIQFESSGLTQKAFCMANDLKHKQFVYRWNARNRIKRKPNSSFERVLLPLKSPPAPESSCSFSIYLPNALRCEVKVLIKEVKQLIEELSHVNPL